MENYDDVEGIIDLLEILSERHETVGSYLTALLKLNQNVEIIKFQDPDLLEDFLVLHQAHDENLERHIENAINICESFPGISKNFPLRAFAIHEMIHTDVILSPYDLDMSYEEFLTRIRVFSDSEIDYDIKLFSTIYSESLEFIRQNNTNAISEEDVTERKEAIEHHEKTSNSETVLEILPVTVSEKDNMQTPVIDAKPDTTKM